MNMSPSTVAACTSLPQAAEPNQFNATEEGCNIAVSVLKSLNLWEVEAAIATADRSTVDAAGRQWKIGESVGRMVRDLLYHDGKGELPDGWIHRTASEWKQKNTRLSARQLRTGRDIARQEGLIEEKEGLRPSDRRPTVYYRLNLWKVAQVVVRSELARTRELLQTEGRPKERDRLNKRRREMEQAQRDLSLIDAPNPGDVVADHDKSNRQGYPDNLKDIQQERNKVTSVPISKDIDTPVREDAEPGKIINSIYSYLKEHGYQLSNRQYSYNLSAIRSRLENGTLTSDQLEALPDRCREDVRYHRGVLDVHRVVNEMVAGREAPDRRHGRKPRWARGQDVKEGPTLGTDPEVKDGVKTYPNGYVTHHHQEEEFDDDNTPSRLQEDRKRARAEREAREAAEREAERAAAAEREAQEARRSERRKLLIWDRLLVLVEERDDPNTNLGRLAAAYREGRTTNYGNGPEPVTVSTFADALHDRLSGEYPMARVTRTAEFLLGEHPEDGRST